MIQKLSQGYIASVDTNSLRQKDILDMYDIERDTWSHFMGEYVKCESCNINYSKKDIYWNISSDYWLKSVWELENEYWRNNLRCPCCSWKVKDLRGEELISIIESRLFDTKKGFVNFYKSSVGKILWFAYWFVDTPENTYIKEFKHHFNDKLLYLLKKEFWNQDLLTLSGVCVTQDKISIRVIYEILKNFYCTIDPKYDKNVWIWESIKWTPSNKIYKRMLPYSFDIENESNSEILYQYKAVYISKKYSNSSITDFLKSSK